MTSFQQILVPTDFSTPADDALAYATSLAERLKAKITLFTSIDKQRLYVDPVLGTVGGASTEFLSKLGDAAAKRIEEKVADLEAAGIPAEGRMAVGDPANRIRLVADEIGTDMIVMGTHGRHGFKRLLLGSVTERVVQTVGCPVLAVPPSNGEVVAAPPLKILVATDFSTAADAAVAEARMLATVLRAEVLVFHTWEPPHMSYGGYPGVDFPPAAMPQADIWAIEASLSERLEKVADAFRSLGLTAKAELLRTRPSDGILEAMRLHEIDLIVLGTHGRTGLSRMLLGSVTNRVLRQATCPVLAVPASDHLRRDTAKERRVHP